MSESIIEKYSKKRPSPVLYKDVSVDIFRLCWNTWPLIDMNNLMDSFKSEIEWQLDSFDNDADRLKFLEYLHQDLMLHNSICKTANDNPLAPNPYHAQCAGSDSKPQIVYDHIRKLKDKMLIG